MKFKSQICTTREQSERLLSLGLKKDTADFPVWGTEKLLYMGWSLHRLIEMMPTIIKRHNQDWELSINGAGVIYFRRDTVALIEALADNVYHNMINCIEWLIKEGYFNKEYLEEKV